MQEIKVAEGTIFYWRKSLTAFIAELGATVKSITPNIVTVKDNDRLLVDLNYEYTAKGQKFLATRTLWCNREVNGDDREVADTMGAITEGELHFGIFMPNTASPEDIKILKGLETPGDFVEGVVGLSDKGLELVQKGMANDWKVDMLTDGVNILRPTGDRIQFSK